jgi:uncharacterized membrane protein
VTLDANCAWPDSQGDVALDSLDLLCGLVMVLMSRDRVRDLFTNVKFDPLDLTETNPPLFLTRWITHFCAPVFIFLAGTGGFLSSTRGKSKRELSWFLFTRARIVAGVAGNHVRALPRMGIQPPV